MKRYFVTDYRKMELLEQPHAPGAKDIAGHTIATLISAGTEVTGCYLNSQNWNYPIGLGYAAVFRVDYVGEEAQGFRVGDVAFCCGAHADYQVCRADEALKVPEGVTPEEALFCRMAGISMATLSRTTIHAGDRALVTGLGAVGLLAMQAYACCGYRVTGTDPDADRAAMAAKLTGLPTYASLPQEETDRFGLALECSGTQQGALSCCHALREGGQLSLVGVPWRKTGDVHSYDVLNRIFYKYLTVVSGWEMNLPVLPKPFSPDSQMGNMAMALEWIRDGRIRTDGMWVSRPYDEAPAVYEDILEKREKHISVILDWRNA